MSKLKHMLAVLAAVAIILSSSAAHASHFRYGSITYTIPDPANAPRTVKFEVVGGFRSGFPASFDLNLEFGDGAASPVIPGVVIGTGVDASGVEYTLLKYVMTHTYPSNGNDQFIASRLDCCRTSNLLNAPDAVFAIHTKVDLTPGNTGSPTSFFPPIIQLQTGGVRSHFIPALDPDTSQVTCRFSTPAESGDSSVTMPPVIGAVAPTLTQSTNPPGCDLTWDTTGGLLGSRFATQVTLESVNPGNGKTNSAAIDYMIELVQSPVPTCAGSGAYTIPMGTTLTTNLIGTNNAGGASLLLTSFYANGLILPASGAIGPSPFTSTFHWTPGLGDEGTALATVIYTDQKNQSGYCSLVLNVPSCPQFGQVCTVGVGQCQSAGILTCNGSNVVCTAVAGQPSAELCDNIDNNCDGQVDEGNPESGHVCATGLPGACSTGQSSCAAGGVLQCIPGVAPGTLPEVCNGQDDDCDGTVDDGFSIGEECSAGVGSCQNKGTYVCDALGGSTCSAVAGDPKPETCDGKDDDCDGAIDEDFNLGAGCSTGTGACSSTGVIVCDLAGGAVCDALPIPPTPEICGNHVDDDCDGTVDNGCEESGSSGSSSSSSSSGSSSSGSSSSSGGSSSSSSTSSSGSSSDSGSGGSGSGGGSRGGDDSGCSMVSSSGSSFGWLVFATGAVFTALRRRHLLTGVTARVGSE